MSSPRFFPASIYVGAGPRVSDPGVLKQINDLLSSKGWRYRVEPLSPEQFVPAPPAAPVNGFRVDDEVRWTSQSAGIVKQKRGRVVEVVPAGTSCAAFPLSRPRDHESYVVLAAGVDEGGSRRKRTYWPLRKLLMLAALALSAAACGATPGDDDLGNADASSSDGRAPNDGRIAPDADPAAPDAAPGDLPLNAMCDPVLEQCAGGLTCRVRHTNPVYGLCLPVGSTPAGGDCTASGDDGCAADMACVPGGTGDVCMVVCATAAPADRCSASEVCSTGLWGPDVGVCSQ